MSDKEILIQAFEKYTTDLISKLFGISSLPSQTLIKYAIRNAADKYGSVLDLFVDKTGKINSDLMMSALKAELKNRGGYTFMNIKFTESDVDELSSIIDKFRANSKVA